MSPKMAEKIRLRIYFINCPEVFVVVSKIWESSTSIWENDENDPNLLLFSDGLKAPTRRFPPIPQNFKNGYAKETYCI